MRTNKACPLYSGSSGNMNVALTEEQEDEIQRDFNQDDEELVNLEDTKVTLSGKLIKVYFKLLCDIFIYVFNFILYLYFFAVAC